MLRRFDTIFTMMTSSNGNIFRVTGPLCGNTPVPGEFPAQKPVTRSFGVFFDLHLNKPLSKQPRGWWFETRLRSLWRHFNKNPHNRHLIARYGVCFVRTYSDLYNDLVFDALCDISCYIASRYSGTRLLWVKGFQWYSNMWYIISQELSTLNQIVVEYMNPSFITLQQIHSRSTVRNKYRKWFCHESCRHFIFRGSIWLK